eukprot:1470452-Prymnesium_polylepis.1
MNVDGLACSAAGSRPRCASHSARPAASPPSAVRARIAESHGAILRHSSLAFLDVTPIRSPARSATRSPARSLIRWSSIGAGAGAEAAAGALRRTCAVSYTHLRAHETLMNL